jgi:hypothetical protein
MEKVSTARSSPAPPTSHGAGRPPNETATVTAGRAWAAAVNGTPANAWLCREEASAAHEDSADADAMFLAIASAFDLWGTPHRRAAHNDDSRTLPQDAIMATAHAVNRCISCERSETTMALIADVTSETTFNGASLALNVHATHRLCGACVNPDVFRSWGQGQRMELKSPPTPAPSSGSRPTPVELALCDPAISDAAYLLAQAQYLVVRLTDDHGMFGDVIRAAAATIGTLPALRPPPMSAGLHLMRRPHIVNAWDTARPSLDHFEAATFARCRITRLTLEHLKLDAEALSGLQVLALRQLCVVGAAASLFALPGDVLSPASGEPRLVDTLHTLILKSTFQYPLACGAFHVCRRLEHVTLHGVRDVDDTLSNLGRCANLRSVRIRAEKELSPVFSDLGLVGVASETLEHLQVEVQLASGPFTRLGSEALAERCPKLHTLGLSVGFGPVKFHDEGFMTGLGSIASLRRVKLIASAVALGPFGRALSVKSTGAPVLALSTMSVSGYAGHIVQQLMDAPQMAVVRVGGGSSQQVKASACPAAWAWLEEQGLVRPRIIADKEDMGALARAIFNFDA